jgi:O-antigen/teichoic acid export membrane protein
MVFGFFVIAARTLGAELFGVFTFALAHVALFAPFADMGLGFLTAREIARDRGSAAILVGRSMLVKLVATIVLALASTLVVRLSGYPALTVRVVDICALFIVGSTYTLYMASVFQGFERMHLTALVRLVQTALLFGLVLLLSARGLGVAHYAAVYVFASLVAAVGSILVYRVRLSSISLRGSFRDYSTLLARGLPFGLAAIFVMLYYWNSSALLYRMHGDLQAGYFGAAFRLVLGGAFLANAFSGAVYPALARLFVSDPVKFRSAARDSVKFMTVLAVPALTAVVCLARPLALVVYGTDYLDAVPALRVLGCWAGCAFMNSLLSSCLYASDRPRVIVLQTGSALVVNVTLNLIVIGRLGALGAALSLAFTEACSTAFLLTQLHRRGVDLAGGTVWRSAIAAVAAAGGGYLAGRYWIPGALLAFVPIHAGTALLLGTISRADSRRMLGAINWRGRAKGVS